MPQAPSAAIPQSGGQVAKFGLHFLLKDEDRPFMTVHPRFDNAPDAATFAHHLLRDDILRESVVVINVFQEQPCAMRIVVRAPDPAVSEPDANGRVWVDPPPRRRKKKKVEPT